MLFMDTKLADVHSNVNTEKNVFYSAYLKGKVQYNDVDPDKAALLKIEDEKKEYFAVSEGDVPIVKEEEEEQESGKIIVTIHDITSNPSSQTASSNDLQKLE